MNENLSSAAAISSKAARKQNNSSSLHDELLDSQVSNSLRRPILAQYRNRSSARIHRGILDSDSSDEAENQSPSRSKQTSQDEKWLEDNNRKQEEQNKRKSLSDLSMFSAILKENKSFKATTTDQVSQPKENTMEDKLTENLNSVSIKSISEINQSMTLKEPEKRSKAPRKLSTIQSNRNITAQEDKHNKHNAGNKNISSSVLSSVSSSSSKSDSHSSSDNDDEDDDHYESVKVQMYPFNKKDILKYSSRKQDQSNPEVTEVKIPKDPSFFLSPDVRQSQSRSVINSPTRGSSPLQRSGRYIWTLNIGLVAKIKVLFHRLGKATSIYRTTQLNSNHLDLIGDLSIMRESDEKERKAQQKLVHRLLNSYMVFPTFNPYSIYKMAWDMLMLLLIIYLFFAIPLILSFGVDFSDLFGDFPYVTLAFFLIADALVNANTGFYRNGALVVSKYMVFRNYAKKILFIDVFGITPVLVYTLFPSSTSKLFLFLYVVKYKSITKIFKRIELRLDLKTSLLNKIALLKLLFAVLFIAHLFANFWIMLPQFNSQNNWFRKASINNEAWYIQYVTAYYYITVTMVTVGYGDITPSNYLERFFSIITILLSCAVFAYSVNSVGFILEEINREQKNLNKNMQVINSYMDQKNISRELRYQIREYLEFFWREQNAGNVEQEQQIITQLAYNLRQKLFVEANKLILKDNKIFSGRFSERVLMKALKIVKEYKYTPQQVIFEKNQSDDCSIYFIENGNVEIFYENEKTSKTLQIQNLGKGDYFGEIGFYTGQERSISVKSLGLTTLLKIDREDFLGILKQFPKDEELFNLIKDQIIFCQGYGQNGTNCYACKSGLHLVSSCPMVQFVPNKVYCYGRYNYNPGQSREPLERTKRLKNCSLKDIELVQEGVENIQDNYPDLVENTQSSESEENSSYYEDSFNGFVPPEGNDFYYENETEDSEQFARQLGENLNRIKSNSDSTTGNIQRISNVYQQQQQQQIYPKSSFFNITQQNPPINSFARESLNGYNSNLNENSIINEINEDSQDSDSQQDIRTHRGRLSSSNNSREGRRNSQLKDPPNQQEIRNKLKRGYQIELDNSLLDKLSLSKSRSKSLSQQKIKINSEDNITGSLNNSNNTNNNNNILQSLATIKSIQNLPIMNEETDGKQLSEISLKEKRSSKISDNTKDTTTSNRSSSGIFAIKQRLSESDRESSKITTDPDRTSISIPRNSLTTNEKNTLPAAASASGNNGVPSDNNNNSIASPDIQVKGRVFTFDRTFNSVKQNSSCNIPENANAIYGQDQLNQYDNDSILNQQLHQLNQKGSFGCMGMIQSKQLQLLQQQILLQNSLSQSSSSRTSMQQQQLSSGRNSSSASSPWIHEETPRFFARSRSSLATNTLSSPRDSVQFSYYNNKNQQQRQSCFCSGNSSNNSSSNPQCMNNLRGLCMMMPKQSRQFNQTDSVLSSNRSSAVGQPGGIRQSNIRRQDSVFLPGGLPANIMNYLHKQSLCSSRKSSQKNNSRGSSDENYNNNNIYSDLRNSSAVIDIMQKKITAIYDKLITESVTEQALDSPLIFDKQQDYTIYFPSGNLSAVLAKRKVLKKNRSPNHSSKLTHFLLNQGSRNPSSSFNQIQTSEEMIKLSKTPSMMMMGQSQQYLQMKQKSPNVITRLHSSFNVSPKSRSQLQKKLNTLIVPQKMSEDSQDIEGEQSEKNSEKSQEILQKQLYQQQGKRSSSIFRPRESLEISMSPTRKKKQP